MKKRVFVSIIFTAFFTLVAYPIWHKGSILIFTSVLILSSLLSYKVSDYVADFKTIKGYSRVDIAFLTVFFAILLIPMSNIDKNEKSWVENRLLAPAPVLTTVDNSLNLNFGKDFNAWFNDRFAMRQIFIDTSTTLNCFVESEYCNNGVVTFYKKGNLMYRENFWGLKPIKKDKEKILAQYIKNLNSLEDFCNKNKIKLYFLVVPRQKDFFDFPLADERNYKPNPADEVIEYLRKNTNIKFVYPKEQMLEANKETPVYFKTDHHWTKKGAYIGYYELMKVIKKDFPSLPILEENTLEKFYDKKVSEHWNKKLNNGQTYKHSRLPKFYAKKVLDTPYLYYKNPNKDKLKDDVEIAPILDMGYTKKQDNQFYYPDGLDKKALVIGDSFAANLMEFFPYSFKYTARYYDNRRYSELENYDEVFEKYKPDIFVYMIYSTNLNRILNFYPNKYRSREGMS